MLLLYITQCSRAQSTSSPILGSLSQQSKETAISDRLSEAASAARYQLEARRRIARDMKTTSDRTLRMRPLGMVIDRPENITALLVTIIVSVSEQLTLSTVCTVAVVTCRLALSANISCVDVVMFVLSINSHALHAQIQTVHSPLCCQDRLSVPSIQDLQMNTAATIDFFISQLVVNSFIDYSRVSNSSRKQMPDVQSGIKVCTP